MNDSILTLIIAIISAITGSGLTGLIVFFIERKDKKSDKQNEILKRLERIESTQKKQELSELRTEMSIHLLHHPRDVQTIMKLAEHYFKDLNGDFYMTSKFYEWLKKRRLPKPSWFDPHK